jgi:hypothetical protein
MNILVIPDLQAKPGQRLRHVYWLAEYIKAKQPDVIVQLGDLWDIPSLSSYDVGKKSAEGKRLCLDVDIGMKAVRIIEEAIASIPGYKPKKIFTEGNHEYRIRRYENDHPALAGSLFNPVDYMADLGWDAYPFLAVAKQSGISFSHFFPRTSKGTTSAASQRNGASSATAMVKANMTSCIAGHKQGLDTYIHNLQDHRVRGIIAGSFYEHNEGYHSPQGNSYWRGVLMLNNVKNGDYDLTEVSIDYLRRRYG